MQVRKVTTRLAIWKMDEWRMIDQSKSGKSLLVSTERLHFSSAVTFEWGDKDAANYYLLGIYDFD